MLLYATLSASFGCFTGLVFALVTRSGEIKGAIVDAMTGTVGGLLMAWFIAPISDSGHDPDSLNLAAMTGAAIGALVLVAVAKTVRGR